MIFITASTTREHGRPGWLAPFLMQESAETWIQHYWQNLSYNSYRCFMLLSLLALQLSHKSELATMVEERKGDGLTVQTVTGQ